MADVAYLELKDINKSYADNKVIFDDLQISINSGEFIIITGLSGCGKTTLLRMICGLDTNYQGQIILQGKVVAKPMLECSMVFQEPRLLPWLTIEENLAVVIADKNEMDKNNLIRRYLSLVGLEKGIHLYPEHLSGGMKQRVSLARALINKPQLLLLDEPFCSLDAFTKYQLQNEMKKIWQQEKITTIMVTHDIDEAVFLGTRIIVLAVENNNSIFCVKKADYVKADDNLNDVIKLREIIKNKIMGNKSLSMSL